MSSVHTRNRVRCAVGLAAAFLCLALGADALQFAPAGNIAAQWTFDTVTGTTTPDSSGNGNTATLVAGPTSVAGLAGNGLQFNGSTQYLTTPNVASVDVGSGSFSVSAWVKPGATTPSRILNKWDGSKGWVFDIHTGSGGGGVVGDLRVKMNDGTTNIDQFLPAGIGSGTWTHIAATIDRTANQLKLFVNGAQVGATLDISTMTGSLSNTALVGMGTIPPPLAIGNCYNGVLDEVLLYKRVLTGPELTSLATLPPPAPGTLVKTDGVNKVQLDWLASAGAASYQVLRSGTSGGPYVDPYVPVATGLTGLTYTDNTAANPNTYYYVVIAVAGATPSAYSNEVVGTPLPAEVTALPNTGLQTSENVTSTNFTIKFNQNAAAAGSVVTVDSNNTAEGTVSTTYTGVAGSFLTTPTGFQVTVPGNTAPTFQVTVTGVNDFVIDGNKLYTVSVSATGFTSLSIPNISLTNNDNDTPGITFSKTAGLLTSESGATDTFSVSLNTQPNGPITMSVASSNTAEATVSTNQITFNTSNWNTPQVVTVTGVDDAVLDFNVSYTIITGNLSAPSDLPYDGMPTPGVSGVNLENEVIPEPTHAWGGSGCGLTGAEAALALVLAALARRRRRA